MRCLGITTKSLILTGYVSHATKWRKDASFAGIWKLTQSIHSHFSHATEQNDLTLNRLVSSLSYIQSRNFKRVPTIFIFAHDYQHPSLIWPIIHGNGQRIICNKVEYSALDASRRCLREGVTDLRMDGPTDGQTDTPSYRHATSHLKNNQERETYAMLFQSSLLIVLDAEWGRALIRTIKLKKKSCRFTLNEFHFSSPSTMAYSLFLPRVIFSLFLLIVAVCSLAPPPPEYGAPCHCPKSSTGERPNASSTTISFLVAVH